MTTVDDHRWLTVMNSGDALHRMVDRIRVSNVALCYGSISLFTTILHNVFLLYHIEMFVSVLKIDKTSFWIGETLFLLWNSVNDPLFGWIGDRHQLSASGKEGEHGTKHNDQTNINGRKRSVSVHRRSADVKSDAEVVQGDVGTSPSLIIRRTQTIAIFGPLLALSFAVLWFDWLMPALQFTICLCVYDAFLTIVDLHLSALLADLSITAEARANMNSYESIFSAFGATSVFISYLFWNKTNLVDFRIFCVSIAVFAAIGFYVMSSVLRNSYIRSQRVSQESLDYSSQQGDTARDIHMASPLTQRKSMKMFLRQLMTHKNFLMFTIINIIQVFHCHFNSNFFPLFMEALVEDHKHYGAFLIGVSFVLPHLNNLLFLKLSRYWGLYRVIKLLFGMKLLLAVFMWNTGISYGWLMCFFIASNRVFTEGTCKLLTLVITDLVDEDYVRNSRSEPVSALIFGMANFLAKPGQTLAPIVGTALISSMTGQDIFSKSSKATFGSIPDGEDGVIYKDACFKILVYIPLICGALQIMAWSFFKLHGAQLQRIKNIRSNLQWLVTV